jgi:hypothetical protein
MEDSFQFFNAKTPHRTDEIQNSIETGSSVSDAPLLLDH